MKSTKLHFILNSNTDLLSSYYDACSYNIKKLKIKNEFESKNIGMTLFTCQFLHIYSVEKANNIILFFNHIISDNLFCLCELFIQYKHFLYEFTNASNKEFFAYLEEIMHLCTFIEIYNFKNNISRCQSIIDFYIIFKLIAMLKALRTKKCKLYMCLKYDYETLLSIRIELRICIKIIKKNMYKR